MLDLLFHSVATPVLLSGVKAGAKIVAAEGAKEALKHCFKGFETEKVDIFAVRDSLTNVLTTIELDPASRQELENLLKSEAFSALVEATATGAHTSDEHVLEAQVVLLNDLIRKLLPSVPEALRQTLSSEIFAHAKRCAIAAWDRAVEIGLLSPEWTATETAKSLYQEGLASTFAKADALCAISAEVIKASDASASRYRQALGRHFSKIRPQSLQGTEEAPVEQIYVEPHLLSKQKNRHSILKRDEAFSDLFRGVLLGNPGGGKSTLAGKLSYDLCKRYEDAILCERKLTPFFVTLRDYARFKKEQSCSIVEYLSLHAKSDFQLPLDAKFFELLLLSGRAFVVFDGLDELMEIQDRVNIRDIVEEFSVAYPAVPILVTSREVGYEKAPLDKTKFRTYRLAPFDDLQVTHYAEKWFSLTRSIPDFDRTRLLAAFLEESALIPDIRSNPLMLGLLCNLYKQDGFLPKNRPDVYSRCADLLFTRWDKHRGITVQLPMENKLRPAMSYLAHWIYSDEAYAAGVPESKLIAETASYLGRWKEDQDEALSIAKEFVSFFKGRAWVFTDIGADKEEALYQFTHRTFLEFFTAEQLVKTHPVAHELFVYLLPRIQTREWDVVCQLSFQIHAKSTESHDTLVDLLVEEINSTENLQPRLALVSFTARILDLVYPTPRKRREAVSLCFGEIIRNVVEIAADQSGSDFPKLLVETLGALVGTSKEDRRINASEMQAEATKVLDEVRHDHVRLQRIVTLILGLSLFIQKRGQSGLPQSEANFWDDVSHESLDSKYDVVAPLLKTDQGVAVLEWIRQKVSAEDLARDFGVASLFRAIHYPFVSWFRYSIADLVSLGLLGRLGDDEDISTRDYQYFQAESDVVGSILNAAAFPIELDPEEIGLVDGIERFAGVESLAYPEAANRVDLLFVLTAIRAEQKKTSYPNVEEIGKTEVFRELLGFACSRQMPDRRAGAEDLVRRRCSNPNLKSRLIEWIHGSYAFIAA